MRKRAGLILVLMLAASAAGCTDVQPWERGDLAKPYMALNANPTNNMMRTHAQISREAASGGDAAEGGGCGCN